MRQYVRVESETDGCRADDGAEGNDDVAEAHEYRADTLNYSQLSTVNYPLSTVKVFYALPI